MSVSSTGLSDCESATAAKSKRTSGPPDLSVALAVRPKVAWKMLDCGVTHGYALIAGGEIKSYRDGRSRKITVESIKSYIARRLALANKQPPIDADTKPRRGRGRPRKVQPEGAA